MSGEIQQLRDAGLGIGAETTPDQVGDFLARWMGFMATVKDMDKQMKAQVIGWCEETKQNVPAGDGSYFYPAYRTEKSCTDVTAAAAALLEHASLEALMDCLASQAFKPGACKSYLPDEVYAGLFKEEVKATLKDGGKAEKTLVKIDPQFTKQRPRQGAAGEQVL